MSGAETSHGRTGIDTLSSPAGALGQGPALVSSPITDCPRILRWAELDETDRRTRNRILMKNGRQRTNVKKGKPVAVSGRSSGVSPDGAQESLDERRRRLKAILRELKVLYPEAECALHHGSAFQLLVATILSAQCTDERVNQATPELFSRYPDAKTLAQST